MGDNTPEPALRLSVAEINALVAAYFDETGLSHSAFTLRQESRLDNVKLDGGVQLSQVAIPPGHLVRILMKGLLYLEAEAQWRGEDTTTNPPRLIDYSGLEAPPFRPIPKEPPAGVSPTVQSPVQSTDSPRERPPSTNGAAGRGRESARSTPPVVAEEDRMDQDEPAPPIVVTEPSQPVASTSKVLLDDPPPHINGILPSAVPAGMVEALSMGSLAAKRKDRDSLGPLDAPNGDVRTPTGKPAEPNATTERRDGKRQKTDMKLDIPPTAPLTTSATSSQGRATPPLSVTKPETPAAVRASPMSAAPMPTGVTSSGLAAPAAAGYFPPGARDQTRPLSRPNSSNRPADRSPATPLSAIASPGGTAARGARPPGLGVPMVSVKTVTTTSPAPAPAPPPVPTPAVSSHSSNPPPAKPSARRSTSPVVARRQRSRSPTGPKTAIPPEAKAKPRRLSASDEPPKSATTPAAATKGKSVTSTNKSPAKSKGRANGSNKANADDEPLPPPRGEAPEFIIPDTALIRLHTTAPHTIPCSWNESLLATGSDDAYARIYDVPPAPPLDGSMVKAQATLKHSGGRKCEVTAVDWNPDGTLLATTSDDTVVRLWTVTGELSGVLSMHQGIVLHVKWSPNGQMLATCSLDYSVIVWNASTNHVRQQWTTHNHACLDVEWFDNEYFATCSADAQIHLLALGRTTPLQRMKGHTDECNLIAFDPSRTLLASGSDDYTVRIWSLVGLVGPRASEREPEEGEDLPDLDCRGGSIALRGHTLEITQLKWLPKGGSDGRQRLLASGDAAGDVKLWDVDAAACLYTLQRHVSIVHSIAFRADGQVMATAAHEGRISFWSVKDGKLLAEQKCPDDRDIVYEVVWHPRRNQMCIIGTVVSVLCLDGIAALPAVLPS